MSLFCSIVIPTTGAPTLARTLRALPAAAGPLSAELLLVFDGPLPAQTPLLPALEARILHQPPSGPARARNLGAAAARGQWILFLDDDCLLPPGFLTHLPSHPAPLLALGATPALPPQPGLWAHASHLVTEAFFLSQLSPNGHPAFLPSQCFALPRHAWLDSGGFDTSFPHAAGEDRDFCQRWLQRGGQLRRLPVSFTHHHPLTLSAFLRKHHQYGAASTRLAASSSPGSFLSSALRLLAAARPFPLIPPLAFALFLSQCAALAGRAAASPSSPRYTAL